MEFNKQDGVKQSSKGEWGVGWGEGVGVGGGALSDWRIGDEKDKEKVVQV